MDDNGVASRPFTTKDVLIKRWQNNAVKDKYHMGYFDSICSSASTAVYITMIMNNIKVLKLIPLGTLWSTAEKRIPRMQFRQRHLLADHHPIQKR